MTYVFMILFGIAASTATILALRQSGLVREVVEADTARESAEEKLRTIASEYSDYRSRTVEGANALQEEISYLRTAVQQCAVPGAFRDQLERLLSKASGLAGGDSEGGVSGDRG